MKDVPIAEFVRQTGYTTTLVKKKIWSGDLLKTEAGIPYDVLSRVLADKETYM